MMKRSEKSGLPEATGTIYNGETYIDLGSNQLSSLQAGTFPIRYGPTTIYFSANQITSVEPGTFFFSKPEDATSDEDLLIDFSDNLLQTLASGTFLIRPGSLSLGFYGNQLTSIEPGIFVLPEAPVPAGNETFYMYVSMYANDIEGLQAGTFPLMHGVVHLMLESNQITSVEPGTFFVPPTTGHFRFAETSINLSENKLQHLEARTFPIRDGSSWLQLDFNNIASIEPGTFVLPETTEYLKIHLYLESNNMTTIDEDVFGEVMSFILELTLKDNPLICGCDMAWLVVNSDFMATVDPEATCADGANLHDLDPADFADCFH